MKNITLIFISLLLTGCSLLQTQQTPSTNNVNNDTIQEETKKIISNQISQKEEINNNQLDLSGQNLQKIPNNIFTQIFLKELNISNNKLTGSIPAEIRHLQDLEILNASNNQMTGVPAEIGQLENLKILDLSNNQLTGLPNELGNLKNLKTLNLSGNNYSTFDLDIIQKKLPASVNIIK